MAWKLLIHRQDLLRDQFSPHTDFNRELQMRGCEVDSKSQFYILCVMNIEIVGLNGVPEQNPHKQALFTVTHQYPFWMVSTKDNWMCENEEIKQPLDSGNKVLRTFNVLTANSKYASLRGCWFSLYSF